MKDYSGISGKEVLKICTIKEAILLTEDSDFGEWVFSYHKDNCEVIFLRYNFKKLENIITKIKTIPEKHRIKLYNKFTVITARKVRIRDI